MERASRRAEALAETADRCPINDPAAFPAAQYLAFRLERDSHRRLFETERLERFHRVRGHLHPGADLAEFRRLLIDGRVDAAPVKRNGRCQPGHAAADDCDPWIARHSPSPLTA